MSKDNLQDRVHGLVDGFEPPSPNLEDVYRRAAGGHRGVRGPRGRVGWALAAAGLVLAIVLPLAALLPLLGPQDDDPSRIAAPPGGLLRMGGIEVELPPGWDGQIRYVPGRSRPVIHLASFSLPKNDDLLATNARARLQEDDVLIGLAEAEPIGPWPGYRKASLPMSLTERDFMDPFDVAHDAPPQASDIPDLHAFARRRFIAASRHIDMWVEFGQTPAPEELVAQVNLVLGTIQIGRYEAPQQPDGLCTDWIDPKDPDCPQVRWLENVLRAADFDVVTPREASRLVAVGNGTTKFYVWMREPTFGFEALPLRNTIAGVQIRGDGYLTWRVQNQVVSIAPYFAPSASMQDGSLPSGSELESLVRAAIRVPYPNPDPQPRSEPGT